MARPDRTSNSVAMSATVWWPHVASSLITLTSIALITLLWRKVGALPNPEVLLLLTVAITTYIAGGMAGMLSAAIVLFSAFWLFSSQGLLFRYTEMDWRQAMLIVVASPLIALMVGSLKEQVDRLRVVTRENADLKREVDRLERVSVQLRSCEEMFRLAADGVTTHAIIALDARGIVKSWSPAAQAMTGYEPHEILGQSYSRLFTKDEILAGQPDLLLERAQFAGRVEDDAQRLTKSGPRFQALTVMSAVKTATGTVTGFVMVMSPSSALSG